MVPYNNTLLATGDNAPQYYLCDLRVHLDFDSPIIIMEIKSLSN